MILPKRGEVWLAEFGLAAKVRPVRIFSVPFADQLLRVELTFARSLRIH